jgi:hypothetical protein
VIAPAPTVYFPIKTLQPHLLPAGGGESRGKPIFARSLFQSHRQPGKVGHPNFRNMKYFPFLLLFFANVAAAQFHIPVSPGKSGQQLLDEVKSNFKPATLLPEGPARDTLFSVIYGQNDSLTCVYTGFKIWLDPSKDPTQAAFDFDINTEHTFPKSFGAVGVAEGDMHHLYATRSDVNNARGNSPFAEIPDNETDEWYYLASKTSSVPTTNIDLYSERKGDRFEPREDHKGNVARAMFYFYTMYKDFADPLDPNFFENQRETLCAWHLLDPVDQAEWDRTWLIAQYQDGKPNPFVLDCTLPERSYCEASGEICTPTSTATKTEKQAQVAHHIQPNPFRGGTVLVYALPKAGHVKMEIFSLDGNLLERLELGQQNGGEHSLFWEPKPGTAPGLYFYKLTYLFENQQVTAPGKFVILP